MPRKRAGRQFNPLLNGLARKGRAGPRRSCCGVGQGRERAAGKVDTTGEGCRQTAGKRGGVIFEGRVRSRQPPAKRVSFLSSPVENRS